MQSIPLYANVQTQQFTTADGGTLSPLTFVQGDKERIAFKLCEVVDGLAQVRNDIPIRAIRASIGYQAKAPTSGGFKISTEPNPGEFDYSDSISFDDDGAEFSTAAPSFVDHAWLRSPIELVAPSHWRIPTNFYDTDEPPVIRIEENALLPRAFIDIQNIKFAGKWDIEIRLFQSALAATEDWDRVLPGAPTVTEIAEGTAGDGITEAAANSVQQIYVPLEFQGTFRVKYDLRTSQIIGTNFSPQEIEDALNAMYSDGIKRFSVSLPEDQKPYVEFVGPLGSLPQDLMEIEVRSFQPGTPTFEIDLNTVEMAYALRGVTKLENVPFEIEVELTEPEDAEPEVPGRIITFQTLVTLNVQQIAPDSGIARYINWLTPPEREDYNTFTVDQIITGIQVYEGLYGNGSARTFVVVHNLATTSLSSILVVNNTTGLVARHGVDYTATITDSNQVTVALISGYATPATNGLHISIQTAGPISAFQAHTHTIAQIVGLQDALDAFDARLAIIEDRLPTSTPALNYSEAVTADFVIPDFAIQYPSRFTDATQAAKVLEGPVTLKHYGYLLPAVHDATATDTASLPALTAGSAYTATAAITTLSGGGHKSSVVPIGGFLAADGSQVYQAVKAVYGDSKTSYFPAPFERELFCFSISEQTLRQGRSFQLTFDLELQAIGVSRAQYYLIIDLGVPTSQSSPSTTAPNLDSVTWRTVPIVEQKIILTEVLQKWEFGFSTKRGLDDSFTANAMVDGLWIDAPDDSEPADKNFMVRARLGRFDTENGYGRVKGAIWTKLSNAQPKLL